MTDEERFWPKVRFDLDGCWRWTASKFPSGYGAFGFGGRRSDGNLRTGRAHRYSYQQNNGPIPEGQVVRHACDNRDCVRPGHLLVGTHQDNMDDRNNRGRTARGSSNGSAKLNAQQVVDIRKLHSGGSLNCREIGDMFGVHKSTIARIISGNKWSHV